jgi:hypothetical protein
MSIPIGTPIATFNYYGAPGTNGFGPSPPPWTNPHGVPGVSHTGIYLGQTDEGIIILNQYSKSGGVLISTIPWDNWNRRPDEAGNRYYTIVPAKPGS